MRWSTQSCSARPISCWYLLPGDSFLRGLPIGVSATLSGEKDKLAMAELTPHSPMRTVLTHRLMNSSVFGFRADVGDASRLGLTSDLDKTDSPLKSRRRSKLAEVFFDEVS